MSWLYLAIAILAEVIATSALKFSDGFTKLVPSVVVVVGYGVSFYCLSLTIRHLSLGVVYAVWSGVGIALITIISWFVFGQKLDIAGVIGICLIAGGVLVLNVFSNANIN